MIRLQRHLGDTWASAIMITTQPVFKQALNAEWDSLAPVIQAHYALVPFTDQRLLVKGTMESVSHSSFAKLLIPLTALAGALVPYRGKNVPVEVVNQSQTDKTGFFWQRTFFFPGKQPFVFRSVTHHTGEREVTEYVRWGLGIRYKLSVKNGGLIHTDQGYVWKMGKRSIPLPFNLVMGKLYGEEMPVSDTEFAMKMEIVHPIFGQTFQYNGRFSIV